MHADNSLRSYVLHWFPNRLIRKFRVRGESPFPPVREDPAPEGEWRAIAALVGTGSTVVNVGEQDRQLAETVPVTSSLRTVPIGKPLDAAFGTARPPVDLVNCGAAEDALKTLRSAGVLLRRSKPAWRILVTGDADDPAHSAHAAFHLMQRRGYAAYLWDNGRLRLRQPGDGPGWYFFLAPRHVRRLPGDLFETVACRAA